MSTEIVEQLVIQKKQLEQVANQVLTMLGMSVMTAVKPNDKGNFEVRVSKATVDKFAAHYQVRTRPLKTGGFVVTVSRREEDK